MRSREAGGSRVSSCWMCDMHEFRSLCPHHAGGASEVRGVPLVDPNPRVKPWDVRRN